jgi:predicted nucleic acid-binding protein
MSSGFRFSLTLKIRKYSFYDSMIIAAAREARFNILFSEDLKDNQRIYSLDIVNPYI